MLVTLEDMKDFIGIEGEEQDNYLTAQILLYTRIIENHCNQKFSLREISNKFFFTCREKENRQFIYFYESPIQSIVNVKESGHLVDEEDYELVDDKLYRLNNGRRCCWPNEVEVTYNAGWEEIPEDIQSIVMDLVSQAYIKKESGEPATMLETNDYTKVVIPGVITTEKVARSSYYPVEKGGSAIILGPYIYLLDHYVLPSRTV